MTRCKQYRIKTPTIALAPATDGRKLAITIPEGGVVEVVDEPVEGSRSVNVQWDGKTCEMFIQDLCERGEEVKSAGARLPF